MRSTCLRVCLLALALLPAASPSGASGTRSRPHRRSARQLRTQLRSVRSQIHDKRLQLRETKRKERRVTDQIQAVETDLLGTEARLNRAKARLRYLRREREVLVARIAETERRLVERKRVLARRVRENYVRGSGSYVPILLQSRSVNDYLSRSYYVERIVDSDNRLMLGIRDDQRQLVFDRRRLDAQASEQRELRTELEEEHARYEAQVEQKRDLLHEVRETRDDQEEALDELEQSSQQIEAHIRALQETPRGRARLAHAWTGGFIRPASGPVTSGFGMRFHPILHRSRMHTGVDIGAGYGSAIRAAAGGEVIMAGYMRGYGNTVIVDHGGGVSTLDGHCSAILVSEGQTVRQGQTIARVGSTGLATGPHLHFEVRHSGSPVNPL